MRVYTKPKNSDVGALDLAMQDARRWIFGEDRVYLKNNERRLYRDFFGCDDLRLYFERMKALDPVQRVCHEVFTGTRPCRVFLDVEEIGSEKAHILDRVHEWMRVLGSSKYLVIDGCRANKVSFHVVCQDLVVESIEAVEAYVLMKIPDPPLCIDMRVYSVRKSLRTLYSKKLDVSSWLRVLDAPLTDELDFDAFVASMIQTDDMPNTFAPVTSRAVSYKSDVMDAYADKVRMVVEDWLLMRYANYATMKINRCRLNDDSSVSFYVGGIPCVVRDGNHIHHSNRTLVTVHFTEPMEDDFVYAPRIQLKWKCMDEQCARYAGYVQGTFEDEFLLALKTFY